MSIEFKIVFLAIILAMMSYFAVIIDFLIETNKNYLNAANNIKH